jgi:outer membrane protein OmpA-like peptidoglycan-associated protein
VDPRRFTTRGSGASEPVAPNDNEAGRAKNRRVELVRL